LDYFQVGPEQAGTENYIRHDDISRYRTVRDVTHEIGAVDDLIADGRPRPARVAIVLRESTDLWEKATSARADGLAPGDDFASIAYNAERKFVWTALRHAQVPIDFLTEDDVASGAAGEYRVLYLVGDHATSAAAEALVRWVAAGGVLVSTAGGGFRDEYDSPSPTLLPLFGLKGQELEKQTTFIRPRIELPRLRPIDKLSGEYAGRPVDVPAVAFRQRLDPLPETEVLARFADGSVAATSHRHGSGRATLWGTLLGAAYVQSGFPSPLPPPDRGPFAHTPLIGFNVEWRRLLTRPTETLAKTWAESSDPLVETALLESDRALLVPLANLADDPKAVHVTVHSAGSIRAARSLIRGPLAIRSEGGAVVATVELEVTDFLILER
jgi:hypothetical protein